jgi:ELWxxDGT repeat protein
VFIGAGGAAGNEPWISDGTTVGTRRIADLHPGSADSMTADSWIQPITSGVLLAADDGVHGLEVWRVQDAIGMPSIALLRDLAPGIDSGVGSWNGNPPRNGVRSAGRLGSDETLLFSGTDDSTAIGLELMTTDGSATGTRRLLDLNPLSRSSQPRNFISVGDRVFFTASRQDVGCELWSMSLLGEPNIEPYGTGCAAPGRAAPELQAVGQPRVGDGAFRLRVDRTSSGALVGFLIGSAPANTPLGPSCRLLTQPILGLTTATTTPATELSLPIPADPSLVAASLFGQAVLLDPRVPGPGLGGAEFSAGLRLVLGDV